MVYPTPLEPDDDSTLLLGTLDLILSPMHASDEFLHAMLEDEKFRELFSGRGIIGDYLALRDRNNEIREASVAILFSAVHALVNEARTNGAGIVIEKFDECRFDVGRMSLSGPALRVRHGVRCLTVEAGWTRLPSDGVMKDGSLAIARLTHFGLPEHSSDLHLLVYEERPRWFTIGRDGIRVSFEAEDLVGHFRRVLGDR